MALEWEKVGGNVVLSFRLPATSKAGPLASAFTDGLTLKVVSATSEFHSLGWACSSAFSITLDL